MTAVRGPDGRDVVPRWREFGAATRSGELAAHQPNERGPRSVPDIAEAAAAFERAPGIHAAGDLLSQAFVSGSGAEVVVRAAEFILKNDEAPVPLREIAASLIYDTDDDAHPHAAPLVEVSANEVSALEVSGRRRVARMRAVIRREPGNAIRWADLALAHATVGRPDRAERAIRAAVQLAPTNRHVLRAATRLYVHLDAADRAQALLLREPIVLADPWLLSAELASAAVAGKTSRHLRDARRIVDDHRFAPWHVSELASELATAEFRAGKVKQGRQHMRSALLQPTENALAQAQWAISLGAEQIDATAFDVQQPYEAQARYHSGAGNWAEAIDAGLRWQIDQPFAVDPGVFTSFVASVAAENYEAAAHAARIGLRANPGEATLSNNLAFALVSLGQIDQARSVLGSIKYPPPTDGWKAALHATEGLVAFRSGSIPLGRALYAQAVELLRRVGENDMAALAGIFWAREEVLAKTDDAPRAFRAADEAAKQSQLPEVELWRERLQRLSHPSGPRRT